MFYLIIVL